MRQGSTRSRIIMAGELVLVLAFVVLGTQGARSFDEGAALAKEGYAPTIAFSVPASSRTSGARG